MGPPRALHQRAAHGVGHAAGLLGALDLHRPALHDLPPAVAHVLHLDGLDGGADPRPPDGTGAGKRTLFQP